VPALRRVAFVEDHLRDASGLPEGQLHLTISTLPYRRSRPSPFRGAASRRTQRLRNETTAAPTRAMWRSFHGSRPDCDAAKIDGEDRLCSRDLADLARQQRLHHRPWKGPMKRTAAAATSRFGVRSPCLLPASSWLRSRFVLADQRCTASSAATAGALQFAEEHPRHAGVAGDEIDVRDEHRFECGERRSGLFGGLVHARQLPLVTQDIAASGSVLFGKWR